MNSQKSHLFLARLAAPRKAKLRKERLAQMEKREEDRQKLINDPNLKPIKGYEDFYRASPSGHIIGLRQRKPLVGALSGFGYLHVTLCRNKNDQKQFQVHRLICQAFHGDPPSNLHQVNHKNGIKHDNRPDNLEWVTVSENRLHAYQLGLNESGETHHWASLTREQVKEIRKIGNSISQQKIANIFGVSQTCISKILNNKHWKHDA
jgi:hypothetical protein